MKCILTTSCLVLLCVASSCRNGSSSDTAPATSAEAGISLALRDAGGRKLEIQALRGKIVLVDVWATWCPPCRQTIPHLAELSTWKPDDVVIVGILAGDEPAKLKIFEKSTPIPYFVGIGDEASAAAFPAEYLPTLFILDRKGRIVDRWVGYLPLEEIKRRIEARS